MLKGVEVKIGDEIRFINDADLYVGDYEGVDSIIKPKVGNVYTVRGFSDSNGFYLTEIVNKNIPVALFGYIVDVEPGFGIWRFDPANPLIIEVKESAKSKKKVNIVIAPELKETLEEILEFTN